MLKTVAAQSTIQTQVHTGLSSTVCHREVDRLSYSIGEYRFLFLSTEGVTRSVVPCCPIFFFFLLIFAATALEKKKLQKLFISAILFILLFGHQKNENLINFNTFNCFSLCGTVRVVNFSS